MGPEGAELDLGQAVPASYPAGLIKGVSLLAPLPWLPLDPPASGPSSSHTLQCRHLALSPHHVFPSRPGICRAESLRSDLEILHLQLSSAPAQGLVCSLGIRS